MEKHKYKGYSIYSRSKTVYHSCKKTGKKWSEQVKQEGFYISGLGVSVIRKFSTVKKCKEHIDFLIRNNLNITYYNLKGI
jgi:hypothetical protein